MPHRLLRGAAAAGFLLAAGSACTTSQPASDTAAAATATASPATGTAMTPTDSAGWRPLFDGRTLAGWRPYRGQGTPSNWQAVDGVLSVRGKGGDVGDIVTVDQFGDFE